METRLYRRRCCSSFPVQVEIGSRSPRSNLVDSQSRPSSLPSINVLHRNLADIDDDGRLTKDEFAVAMYLVRRKLSGDEIPSTLPASLVLRRPTPDSADTSETQADVTTPTVAANPTVSAELSRVYTPPPPYQENIPAEVEG